MTASEIVNYCLLKNNAFQCYPFGEIPICFKVYNRIFLELYPNKDNFKITVKCDPMLADFYRNQYIDIIIAGYHCPNR